MRSALALLHVFVYIFFRSDLPPGTRDGMPVVVRRFIQCVCALGLIFIWVIVAASSSSAVYFNADGARRATA
jgi:hypothetical protein